MFAHTSSHLAFDPPQDERLHYAFGLIDPVHIVAALLVSFLNQTEKEDDSVNNQKKEKKKRKTEKEKTTASKRK